MIRFLSVALYLIGLHTIQGQSYLNTYPREVSCAKEFFHAHEELLDSVFKPFGIDTRSAISIVAPEIGHYSVWHDLMETTAVSLFYVEMGAEYNDFSIGPFQMKPSFAEQIEREVASLALTNFSVLVNFRATTEHTIRQERIDRLASVCFQATYLAAFISIWNKSHPGNENDRQNLMAIATAYNVGFRKSNSQQRLWMTKKSFPKNGRVKFAYGEIAMEYYTTFVKK